MTAVPVTIRNEVKLAVQAAYVATAAGVLAATWAAAASAGGRVFDGDVGFLGARNRGRLPFVELWLDGFETQLPAYQGGTAEAKVRLRVHVGGADVAVAEALAHEIAGAAVASIRTLLAYDYATPGGERYGALQKSPWGHALDVELDLQFAYVREVASGSPIVTA